MESTARSRFYENLASLTRSNGRDGDRFLLRSALIWLCVARRKLRTHELWIALQIQRSTDPERIQGLISNPRFVDDAEALVDLRRLLGDLVAVHTQWEGGLRKDYISLCGAEAEDFLTQHEAHGGDDPFDIRRDAFAFSAEEAHGVVANVCMAICSVSTLHLAHLHDDGIASTLTLYAWSCWDVHLRLSKNNTGSTSLARDLDSMMYGVAADLAVFVVGISHFLTGPVKVSAGHMGPMKCTAMVQEAQRSAGALLPIVSSLMQQETYHNAFSPSFNKQKSSKHPNASTSLATGLRPRNVDRRIAYKRSDLATSEHTGSTLFRSSGLLSKRTHDSVSLEMTQQVLAGRSETSLIRALASAARSMRWLCMALSQPPLYDELLNEFGGRWSPLDILFHGGNWADALAAVHATSSGDAKLADDGVRVLLDPMGDCILQSKLIRDRVRTLRPPLTKNDSRASTPQTYSVAEPRRTPQLRSIAARIVYELKRFVHCGSRSPTFMVNDVLLLSHRTSSFSAVPSYLSIPNVPALSSPGSFIPSCLSRVCSKELVSFSKPFEYSSSGPSTNGRARLRPQLRASLLEDGYSNAAVYFAAAVLLNHARRILVPWLGSYLYNSPLEGLRISLSNPDFFLDDALSMSWSWVAFMHIQKWLVDLGGVALMSILTTDDISDLNNSGIPEARPSRVDLHSATHQHRLTDIAKIAYLIWSLAMTEFVFDRSLSTVSFLVAYGKLLSGTHNDHIALRVVLERHRLKVPMNMLQLLFYLRDGVVPLFYGAIACAFTGEPGLLLFLVGLGGGVWGVLRYRAKMIVLFELSGMFIAVGFGVAAAALLGLEFWDDPLGLRSSTKTLRRAAIVAKGDLPRGAMRRLQILGGRRVRPLPIKECRTLEEDVIMASTDETDSRPKLA